MKNQITINQILKHCEVSKTAIMIIEQLEFFLKTDEDRQTFLQKYEERGVWRDKKASLSLIQLAKEIGAYHYTYTNDQLVNMPEREALERLFLEPINPGKLFRYKEADHTLNEFHNIKVNFPNLSFMQSLLYM